MAVLLAALENHKHKPPSMGDGPGNYDIHSQ